MITMANPNTGNNGREMTARFNTILVAEDEKSLAAILEKRLIYAGMRVVQARNGPQTLEKVKEMNPDLILLDVGMPLMSGMQVKAELNKSDATAKIPVIFLTAKSEMDAKLEGLRLWADDYITKPFNWDELLARIDALLYKTSYYQQLSLQDDLTKLPNAKYFKKQLAAAFDIALKYEKTFSLAVLDINGFKQINDRLGHQAGDAVLQQSAKIMSGIIRKPDILARYGGDEFVILFSECDIHKAQCALARLKSILEKTPITIPQTEKPIFVSMSAGVVAYSKKIADPEALFALADKAMYEEKNSHKALEKSS